MERFRENDYVASRGCSKLELFVGLLVILLVVFVVVPKAKVVFNNIKVNNAIDTAYSYKESVSNFYMSRLLIDNSFKLNGNYVVNNGNLVDENGIDYNVMISGNKPTSGYLTYENNDLKSGCIVINGFSVSIVDGQVSYTDGCDSTNILAANM